MSRGPGRVQSGGAALCVALSFFHISNGARFKSHNWQAVAFVGFFKNVMIPLAESIDLSNDANVRDDFHLTFD